MFRIVNIYILIPIICFFISFYSQDNLLYKYVYLLPLGVIILNLLFRTSILKLEKSFVFNLIMAQIMIRFAITPLLISNGGYFSVGGNSQNIVAAIFLMLIELFFIYICFYLAAKKYKNIETSKSALDYLKPNFLLIILLGICLIIIIEGDYFLNISLFWDFREALERVKYGERLEVSNFAALLYPFFIALISILLLSVMVTQTKTKFIKYVLLFIIMALNVVFIVGVSRFSILFSILPITFLIAQLYPTSRKKIFVGFLILFVPVLVLTTLSKFSKKNFTPEAIDVFNSASLNAYFAGVGNVSVGIGAYNKVESPNHLAFLLNDLFQNVPNISSMTDDSYKSNILFNKEIYGNSNFQDQIVPLNISGLFHMGYLGIPLYAFIFSLLAFYFERQSSKKNQIGVKFSFTVLSVICASVFMLSISSIFSRIIVFTFFILIPFYFIHKTQMLKKRT